MKNKLNLEPLRNASYEYQIKKILAMLSHPMSLSQSSQPPTVNPAIIDGRGLLFSPCRSSGGRCIESAWLLISLFGPHISDRTKSGTTIVVIVLEPRGSYLIGRFYRNRSAHLKLNNRDQAHQILSDRMDAQCLVS